MPHKFEIDTEANLLKEAFFGALDLEILQAANAAIATHPHFKEGLDFLTDLRKADIPFGYETMRDHIASLPSTHVARQAFVTGNDREYGMIRMFIMLTEPTLIYGKADVFTNMDDALDWLNS